MRKILLFSLLFLVFGAAPVMAQQWQLDTDHTRFYFGIKHTYSTVRGEFTAFSGDIDFDPAQPAKGHINLTVKTASVDTNIAKRDDHLRSADFFAAAQYPEMAFRSTRITREAENRYRVDGVLTIKDVAREMPLFFTYHGQRDNPLAPGKVVAGLDAAFTLDRLAFHVGDGKFYKMGVVGKEVDVLITLELLRDK